MLLRFLFPGSTIPIVNSHITPIHSHFQISMHFHSFSLLNLQVNSNMLKDNKEEQKNTVKVVIHSIDPQPAHGNQIMHLKFAKEAS